MGFIRNVCGTCSFALTSGRMEKKTSIAQFTEFEDSVLGGKYVEFRERRDKNRG